MLITMLADRFEAGGVLRAKGTQVDVATSLALQWIGDGVAAAVGSSRETAQGFRKDVPVVQDRISGEQRAGDSLVSGGVTTLAGDEIAAPASNITIASVATAGNLTGTFYYVVTYVTPLGETAPYPGTPNTTGAITSKQVSLSNIPVSPDSRVTARKLWRSTGTGSTGTDPNQKDYQYLATIADNTTTTYVDNDAANSGITPSWAASNRGQITDGEVAIGSASDQTTFLGFQAFGNGTPGYASVAIGYQALYDNTSGRRNVAVGVYALENNTIGAENTAVGIHAGGGLTGNVSGVSCFGYGSGGAAGNMGNFCTFIGHTAGGGSTTKGSSNVAVGPLAFSAPAGTYSNCVALGPYAGAYASADFQVFIDGRNRTNIAGCQDVGLIYGLHAASGQDQRLNLNAPTRLGAPTAAGSVTKTVASLKAASAALTGCRDYVTDATATTHMSTVAGGGSNCVPVFCNGTNWVIG